MNFGAGRSEHPLLIRPARGPVLVVAPHEEDGALGCAGTLALHAAQGDPIHVLVLFEPEDGPWGPRLARGHTLEHCRLPRREEPSQDELFACARQIARRILDRRATSVYAPWHGELDPLLFAASHATALAVELADFEGVPLGYEVGTPLVPSWLVDVSATWESKRAELEEHVARLGRPVLLRGSEGLAAHRSLLLPAGATHGEAFAHLLDLRIRVPHREPALARQAS